MSEPETEVAAVEQQVGEATEPETSNAGDSNNSTFKATTEESETIMESEDPKSAIENENIMDYLHNTNQPSSSDDVEEEEEANTELQDSELLAEEPTMENAEEEALVEETSIDNAMQEEDEPELMVKEEPALLAEHATMEETQEKEEQSIVEDSTMEKAKEDEGDDEEEPELLTEMPSIDNAYEQEGEEEPELLSEHATMEKQKAEEDDNVNEEKEPDLLTEKSSIEDEKEQDQLDLPECNTEKDEMAVVTGNDERKQTEVESTIDASHENEMEEVINDAEEDEDTDTLPEDDSKNKSIEQETPRKCRSSMVGPVKSVNEDGDSFDEPKIKDNDTAEADKEDPWVIPDSDLKDPQRRICVVTTAALPWRTGTAVNPLLRALYLTRGRPRHHVSLVIPWCEDEDDRNKTLGKEHSFSNQDEQEDWIRDFCRSRAGCPEEEQNLKIIFYPAKYHAGFGSIFPSVDICALIPDEQADIAILEEPEHLNWLRVPKPYKEKEGAEQQDSSEKEGMGNDKQKESTKKKTATAKDRAELGWRFKFRHVVGIIHTNYKAYAEQYGMGAKFITAPALSALNALVIRAYCHRVILLSGTLPSLTPYKEVTCNVHGVRAEFLERPKIADQEEGKSSGQDEDKKHAPVYFIGKLIWAKGFDKILDLENMYREKYSDYFPIDVYGAGGDEKAIKRAFFGRIPQIQRNDSPKSSEDGEGQAKSPSNANTTAEVFTWESSLRSHLVDDVPFKESEKHECIDEFEENVAKRRSSVNKEEINVFVGKALSARQLDAPQDEHPKKRGSVLEDLADKVVPISVIGDTMVKALDTTKATTGAAVAVAKNVVNAGLNATFTNDMGSPGRSINDKADGRNGEARKQKLIFDPPQSVFEFRRNPIQARFLGTKDHVLLRDIPDHKIFLNMSITEVLCTTSAEALAMGKFVILPKHPSNTFFYHFPNCLAYTTLDDCLEKLEWALANDPEPLTEETALKLSWEGANERLFESSAITKDEWEEWEETGKLKSDTDAARFHVETGMKGQLIGKFFARDKQNEEPKSTDETKET